jgi:outer membrane protein assembly factor BamB
MRKPTASLTIIAAGALLCTHAARAQFGRPGDWTTSGYDAQRSMWVRSDPKISVASMQKPEFKFLWKLKLNNTARQLSSLTTPVLMDRLIGYRGFRTLGFVGGSSDKVFVIDTDLGKMEWEKELSASPQQAGTVECPGGLTSALSRITTLPIAPPPVNTSGSGGGRGGPAKSGVGEPGQGAVTLAMVSARRPAPPPPAAKGPLATAPYAVAMRRGAIPAYVLSGSGVLHMLNSQNGSEIVGGFKFLPPNARATALVVLEHIAYVATSGACGGVADGVWALDLSTGQVTNWKAEGGIAGEFGMALGPDGTVYAATGNGELVALEPATLKPKATYKAGAQGFTSSPLIFDHKGKVFAAVATRDGRIHVVDTASMTTAVAQSTAIGAGVSPGALASWQDPSGVRWILASSGNAVVALKLADNSGKLAFEQGWTSGQMASPATPAIINGVVFALSTGEFKTSDNKMTAAQRAQRSSPAVLYAFDGATGKELWNSGKTFTSFVHGAGLSGAGGQLYVGTYDGTLYSFGFPMEH